MTHWCYLRTKKIFWDPLWRLKTPQDDKLTGAEDAASVMGEPVVDNTPNIDKIVMDMPASEVQSTWRGARLSCSFIQEKLTNPWRKWLALF